MRKLCEKFRRAHQGWELWPRGWQCEIVEGRQRGKWTRVCSGERQKACRERLEPAVSPYLPILCDGNKKIFDCNEIRNSLPEMPGWELTVSQSVNSGPLGQGRGLSTKVGN